MRFARDYRAEALTALDGRWGVAVFSTFLAGLIGSAGSTINVRNINNLYLLIIILVVTIVRSLISCVVTIGLCRFNLDFLSSNRVPQLGTIFFFFRSFWKAVGLHLLRALIVFLWSLLLIIPGIMAAYSYCMATYVMADNPDISISEALSLSKQMMCGHRWQLFCLEISFIGWSILCLFTCGIGFLLLAPYINIAHAAFYNEVSGHNDRRRYDSSHSVDMYNTIDQEI